MSQEMIGVTFLAGQEQKAWTQLRRALKGRQPQPFHPNALPFKAIQPLPRGVDRNVRHVAALDMDPESPTCGEMLHRFDALVEE